MNLENIQRFIDAGYELIVRRHISKDRPYHALVMKDRDIATSHHHLGKTSHEALVSLERYLGPLSASVTQKGD